MLRFFVSLFVQYISSMLTPRTPGDKHLSNVTLIAPASTDPASSSDLDLLNSTDFSLVIEVPKSYRIL